MSQVNKNKLKLIQKLFGKPFPQNIRPHDLISKVFHWGFIIVFIYGLIKQVDNVEELEDIALLQFEMVFAAIFLILLLIRYLFMLFTQQTSLPSDTSKIMKKMARWGHLAMYLSLAMIGVTGLAIGGLYWIEIKGGLVMDIAIGLHELSLFATYFSIALHILAALYHRLLGDGIWSSMVPIWKESTDQ